MPDNPTNNDKQIWEYKINDLLKTKQALFRNLFTVLMALCDTEVKNWAKELPGFKDVDQNLDKVILLKATKMYTQVDATIYTRKTTRQLSTSAS